MIFIALAISVLIVFIAEGRIYKKHAFDNIEYNVTVSTGEVFEDEEIYIYEEIRNNKSLPLPYLKVDTELPEGLTFHIVEADNKNKGLKDTYPRIIHSIFVMRGHQQIRRRWRVRCDTRGTYHLGSVTMLADDIFGYHTIAKVFEPGSESKQTVSVLPKAVDLEKHFTVSKYTNGDFIVQSGLLSDPLIKSGVREYMPGDPMNRINWMQTAVRNSLMVNLEEFTNRHMFNIIMNMQARDIEKSIPGAPSARFPIELCLTVVASVLDSVSSENVPVRFICNTPPEQFGEEAMTAARDKNDSIGEKIFVSPVYKGKTNIITALRMLSRLELMISTPIEKMLDHILESPYSYTSGGNIIFVSAYLSERMINFCYAMRKLGVTVVFYITSASINATIIPEDIEVHFKTYLED